MRYFEAGIDLRRESIMFISHEQFNNPDRLRVVTPLRRQGMPQSLDGEWDGRVTEPKRSTISGGPPILISL